MGKHETTSSTLATTPYTVLLYYKFVQVPNPALAQQEQRYLCQRLGLKGRILIAPEGINGTVSGTAEATKAYRDFMDKHPLFSHIEFKADPAPQHAFRKLIVRVKKELVHLGAPVHYDPAIETAPYIEPQELRDILRHTPDDVVILDTRSKYEFEVGRFKDAITIEIDNFREMPQHLDDLAHLKDKKVITYCTGGIRCEKVTGLMMRMGFKKVYQLHGGIIRYGHEVGGENFEGQCYVFDDRITVPINSVNPTVIGHCKNCGAATEHIMNCANAACNDQILLCDSCADQLQGCCTPACYDSPQRRAFDGKGQYHRGENSKQYVHGPVAHGQKAAH